MAQYNLTDNVEKSFTFTIGELEYSFRYPTTPELRELIALNEEIVELGKKKADKKQIEVKNKESEDKMNALVTPVGHDHEIAQVLESQPINVVRNFRSMMKKEISFE